MSDDVYDFVSEDVPDSGSRVDGSVEPEADLMLANLLSLDLDATDLI